MPEHIRACSSLNGQGQDRTGGSFQKGFAVPQLIALNINLPDELLTIAVLSSAFCSYFERNHMPSLFFLSAFPREVLSKGKSNALLLLLLDEICNTGTGHTNIQGLKCKWEGLFWTAILVLLCFQINVIFNDVSLPYAEIWALIIGKQMLCWKSSMCLDYD